jgi:hypothetical protein
MTPLLPPASGKPPPAAVEVPVRAVFTFHDSTQASPLHAAGEELLFAVTLVKI